MAFNRYNPFAKKQPDFSDMLNRPTSISDILNEDIVKTLRPQLEGPRSLVPNLQDRQYLPDSPKPMSFSDRYRQISINPEADRFKQLVESAPKREDFAPNNFDRVGSMMSGFAAGWRNPSEGVGLARNILDRPYNEAMEEHQGQLSNVGTLANLEDSRIKRELEGLTLERGFESDADRFEEDKRRFGIDTAIRNRQLNIQEQGLINQGWVKYDVAETGEAKMYNPQTGETRTLGKTGFTPEEASKRDIDDFSKKEGIRFEHDRRLQGSSHANSLELARTNIEGRLNLAREKNKTALDTARIRAAAANPLTPRQEIDAIYSRLADIGSMTVGGEPVDINKYVDLSGTLPVVRTPWFTPSPEEQAIYDRAAQALKTQNRGGATFNSNPVPNVPQWLVDPNDPNGRIRNPLYKGGQ